MKKREREREREREKTIIVYFFKRGEKKKTT